MPENIKITSKKLSNMNFSNIEEFTSSASFCHYTSVEKLIKILDNKTFRFSPLSIANDIDEATLHKEDGKNIYTFCLCNSDTEKNTDVVSVRRYYGKRRKDKAYKRKYKKISQFY